MKRIFYIAIAFLAASCAKFRHDDSWPARIVSYEGFSDAQKSEMRTFAANMNSRAGRTLLLEGGEEGEGLPITFKIVTPPTTDAKRAGLSTLYEDECVIQISAFMFKEDKNDYRESVFEHEIGHCAKLQHIPKKGCVMSETTTSWKSYSEQCLKDFYASFFAAIGE